LLQARDAHLAGAARGLVFQLVGSLGTLPRAAVAAQLAALTAADRQLLARLGIRIGRESIWLAGLGKYGVTALKRSLWALHAGQAVPPLPAERPLSMRCEPGAPEAYYNAIGYCTVAGLAIRVDALERLAKLACLRARQGPFAVTEQLIGSIGCPAVDLEPVLRNLGFRRQAGDGTSIFALPGRDRAPATTNGGAAHPRRKRRRRKPLRSGDSPFARLSDLRFGK
jgi:ATP-dependent RNA helicase SUPV3L1/SUV3